MSDAPKFDLATSDGGRGYLAHLFETRLKRHDFTRYIMERLAADFACVMSRFVHGTLTSQAEMQKRLEAAEQRIASLHHVGMELMGVIDEYRAMPCSSLQERMFQTSDRYRTRLTAKCNTCGGTRLVDDGELHGSAGGIPFENGPIKCVKDCPDCSPERLGAEVVALTAVATLRDDGDGGLKPDWLLEGGTAELFEGMVLLVADQDQTLCEEDGHVELYRKPVAPTGIGS